MLGALAPGDARDGASWTCALSRCLGSACLVSRSGYTGEDGFEISVPAKAAEALCETLLRDPAVAPVGLGARDSLRLEAGLCLYGSDLDETTTPVEAALEWTIPRARRAGGERAGGFRRKRDDPWTDREWRRPPARRAAPGRPCAGARRRAALPRREHDATAAGIVTSGGFGVSLNAPIAMGYVPREAATPGTRLFAEVRGKRLAVIVSELPFVPTHYKRA